MNRIDEMTAQELRIEIAKELDIKFRVSDGNMDWIVGERLHRDYANAGDLIGTFYYDDGTPYEDIMLDWTTDIAAAWELVEDMTKSFFRVYLFKGDVDTKWIVQCEPRQGHNEPDKSFYVSGNTAPLAICRAWLKWKENSDG